MTIKQNYANIISEPEVQSNLQGGSKMSIANVKDVVIDAKDGYKFIVAELSDGSGSKKLVVRADQERDYHDDILKALKREVEPCGLRARCIGGGRIAVNPTAKTICIWGDSGAFGEEPDREQTLRMLQAAFLDYEVREK